MTAPRSGEPSDPGTFYDAMWDRYAHLDAASPAAFHRRRVLTRLARRHCPGARRILDVGCGPGLLLAELAKSLPDASLSGADVSEATLATCRARLPSAELFTMDLVDPEFGSRYASHTAEFDLVVCSEVIEHIADDRIAVRRVASLLAPGAILLVSVPGGRMSRFDEAIGHQRHYDVARLRALVADADLDVLDVFAWGFPFQNIYRSAVRVASRAAMPVGARSAASTPVGNALGFGYRAFGAALKPLFYLNLSRWGEQLFAVARAKRHRDALGIDGR